MSRKSVNFSEVFDTISRIASYEQGLRKLNVKLESIQPLFHDIQVLSETPSDMGLSTHDIEYMRSIEHITYYRTLTSNRKVFSKIIIFIKRVIRKTLRFLIEPAFTEISKVNMTNRGFFSKLVAFNNDIVAVTNHNVQHTHELISDMKAEMKKYLDIQNELLNAYKQLNEKFLRCSILNSQKNNGEIDTKLINKILEEKDAEWIILNNKLKDENNFLKRQIQQMQDSINKG